MKRILTQYVRTIHRDKNSKDVMSMLDVNKARLLDNGNNWYGAVLRKDSVAMRKAHNLRFKVK